MPSWTHSGALQHIPLVDTGHQTSHPMKLSILFLSSYGKMKSETKQESTSEKYFIKPSSN